MRLRTIGLISALVLGFLAGPLPTEAQQAGKVYRIGYQRFAKVAKSWKVTSDAFRQRLREFGYVEGQNLVIEYRYIKTGQLLRTQAPKLAAELVRLKVDVIVASPASPAIRALQRATRTIPIVMPGIQLDPVKAGFVVSLARPGGNITGLINLDTELHPKRLELLKEAFPGVSRAAILWPEYQQEQGMKDIEAAGQALGVQIQSLDTWDGLDDAFSAISQERADALIVAHSGLAIDHRARIIEFTAKRRLPTIYAGGVFAREGGLMSYSTDRLHLVRRVAIYVDKILKGAKPADLPIEQPTKFELIINLKTAKQLGITIPPTVLYQATKVIR